MHEMNATDTDAKQVKCFTECERTAEKILQKTNNKQKKYNQQQNTEGQDTKQNKSKQKYKKSSSNLVM